MTRTKSASTSQSAAAPLTDFTTCFGKSVAKTVAGATMLFAIALEVSALGFRIPNQDAAAIARANAFVATADNPSALYYNPAGITQLEGHQVQFGIHNLSVNSVYRSPTGSRSKTKGAFQSVPQFYYTFNPEDRPVAFGIALYAPYGLGIEWPQDTGFRTIAIAGEMVYTSLNPTVAWEINDKLSVAGALTLNYAKVMFRQGLASPAATDEFRFDGEDTDIGYTLGIMYKPWEKLVFGAKYRSATSMNFSGTSFARPFTPAEATSARVPFGQFVTAGVSYRPTPKWNFEFDVDWTDWNSLDNVIIDRDGNPDILFPFNWSPNFLYHFGATRTLRDNYFVSCGYFYSQNATSEQSFNPLVPDQNLHVGSVGFGRSGDKWMWAVSSQLMTGPERNVANSNSTSLIGQSANGGYKFTNYAINFSLGGKF